MNFAICARSCVSDRPDEKGVIQTIGHQNASLGIRELIMTIAGGDTFSLNKAAESRFEDGCFYRKYVFGATLEELEKQPDEH